MALGFLNQSRILVELPSESYQDKNYNDFSLHIFAELDKSWNKKSNSTWLTYILPI